MRGEVFNLRGDKLKRKIANLTLLLLLSVFIYSAAEAMTDRSLSSKYSRSPEEKKAVKWHLIWNDEFEGSSLDESKWRTEDAALVKNNELQYYTPENISVHDGLLTLKSDKKKMKDREYTSGLVETKGKFSFQYGRIEIRAKLPRTKGMWPAHWLMPVASKWPPEIDIMELVGDKPNIVHMTNHYGDAHEHKWQTHIYAGPDFTKGFHTFALEWEPDVIRWFIDGREEFSVKENVPQEPFYIILNTAVGGSMPGNPNETTVFPQRHDIDYVRVYGKEIPGTYFLVVSAKNGRVLIDPVEPRYKRGSKVKLQAVADIGCKFDGWRGDISSANNPVLITMKNHRSICADFIVDPEAPKLISRGKKVYASSVEKEAFAASNVVDGDYGTRWSSAFSDPQWIYIDLGAVYRIEAIRLRWEIACAKEYNIQVSDDATNWKNIYYTKDGPGSVEQIVGLDAAGRYVRMEGISRWRDWGYSLWEFEVFGRVVSSE